VNADKSCKDIYLFFSEVVNLNIHLPPGPNGSWKGYSTSLLWQTNDCYSM